MEDELRYWVGFSFIPGIGTARFKLLIDFFGSAEKAWFASASELKAAGLDSRTIENIISRRPTISLDNETEKLSKLNIQAIPFTSPKYPKRLREIYDYPPLIYVRGDILTQDEWSIAVVGTRKASVYGKQAAEEITKGLVEAGITIISGLAKGIDATAHKAALANGGRTIAVLACGLDLVYPSEHRELALKIIEHGALVSEYPLGTKPKAENFPRRNRIMSGMSMGVLVVEAGETSGALITANFALEQNRDVFAVPGPIFSPLSRGTNKLIQEGAKLVQSHVDILEELNLVANIRQPELKPLPELSKEERKLLDQLSSSPVHIDELCRQLSLPISTVSSTLALLEIKGLVRSIGGMNYVLAKEARESYRVKVI